MLFIPGGREKKCTFKLLGNTLMLCFQACVFRLVALEQFLVFVCLLPRMAVKLSLVDLNQKSDCTIFFFPPHLAAGNITTNFDDISGGSCVRISSSASQELFFLVKTRWPC